MRVGLNARLAATEQSFRRTGVNRYIANLLDHLPAALGPDDELIAVGRPPAPDGGERSRLGRAWQHPVARIAWEQSALPILATRGRWDLLHSPVNVAPLLSPTRSVVTVHDLAFLTAAETMPSGRRRYLAALTARSVRRADRVIAVSESTRRDLARWFDLAPDRVSVTPLAADPRFRPSDAVTLSAFRAQNRIDRPYILSVGTREPRKNGALLVRAFADLSRAIPHDLVMVGPAGWLGGELDQALAALPAAVRERVRLTGFVEDADLPLWYGAAEVFAYPTRYEGFGLPVLEAMACGTPVVTSDVSSLPEVAGDAGLLIDPNDREQLATALRRIVTDPALAADLRRRGTQRAARYSWAETARLTVEAYRSALGR